jgi:hypothetical protein
VTLQKLKRMIRNTCRVMIDHAQTVMVNRQLAIAHRTDLFDTILTEVNKKITRALLPVWAEYVSLYDRPNIALRYLKLMQDAFYTRLSFDRLQMDYLHEQTVEFKSLIAEMLQGEQSNSVNQNILIK